MVRNNPTADLPTNLGDVMYPAHFGMRYDQPADITCNTLIAPQGVREVSEETSSGTRMATKVLNLAKAGETFEINFIAENNGADGYINVEVLVDGELADEDDRCVCWQLPRCDHPADPRCRRACDHRGRHDGEPDG